MIIKQITINDTKLIVDYLQEHSNTIFDAIERRQFWEEAFKFDTGIGFMALDNNKICGSISGRIDHIESIGTIDTFFITHNYRAKGLSLNLLNKFEETMYSKQIKIIICKAEKSVMRFLEKNGYNLNIKQFKIKELSHV